MDVRLNRELLLEAARSFGTPLFVYDQDLILERYREVLTFTPWPQVKILYAMKANYNPEILRLLQNAGAGIDAVSAAEAILALKCGFSAEQILFTANNLTEREMRLAYALGVLFNIDDISTLRRFGEIFPESDLCLRFNPEVVAGENAKVQTGGEFSKFGLLFEQISEVREVTARHGLRVVGLHIHTGSGIKEKSKFLHALDNLLKVADRATFPDLRFIDCGGGLAVPYRPGEERVDYPVLGKELAARFAAFCNRYGRDLDLLFEPGKYLTAEAGSLLVQVVTVKRTRRKTFAGTDSGFPHLIRPVLYGAYHHIVNLSNPDGDLQSYDVCGNICESGDLFASDRLLPEIRPGDILQIQNAGAYCYSMGGLYNLRPMPAEALVGKGALRLVRRRASEEDLVDDILQECP